MRRRFPDTILRIRERPGGRDSRGEWVSGTRLETELSASVQPITHEDLLDGEGAREQERLRIYLPGPETVFAAYENRDADVVQWDGKDFVVLESRVWPGRHCRALLQRTA